MNYKLIIRFFTKTRLRKVLSSILAILMLLTSIRFIFLKPNEVKASDVFLKFDEGYGTSSAVHDTNSTVSAGSITGATWKTDDLCRNGKCLYFDGDGDYVSFADDSDLDFAGSDSGTLEGWFRHSPFVPSVDIDHETGDLSDYNATSTDGGDLSVSTNAALNGTGYGMQAVLDDTNSLYAHKTGIGSTSGNARIKFYLDINSLNMTNGDGFAIFYGYNNSTETLILMTINYWSSAYHLSLGVVDDSAGYHWNSDTNLSDAPHLIEIELKRASSSTSSDGWGSYYLDGVLQTRVTGVDNYDRFASFNRTGLGASGADAGTSGTLYFDEFQVFTGTPQTILSKHETTGVDGGYKVFMENDGDITCGIDNDNSGFPSDWVTSTSANYDDNKWHHFACVKSGSSSLSLYLDTQLIGTDSSITSSTLANDDSFYVGIDGDGASNDYQGFIDEVKILRSARTATEIKADFTGETPERGTTASFGGGDQSFLSNGLVGYWKMDESDWTNDCSTDSALDSSGNSNHADSCPSTTGPDPTGGKFGNSGDFDGSDDYLNAGSGTSLDNIGNGTNGSGMTIGAWVYNGGGGTYAVNMIAQKASNSAPSNGWNFYYQRSSKLIAFEADYDGTDIHRHSSDNTVTNSQWNHVVVTWDGSITATNIRFFVNGQEVGYSTTTNATGSRVSDASQNLLIGDSTDGYVFDGKIDDLRIYNRALSPSEVEDLYHWAPGPNIYFKFDEMSGTTTYDSSGNGLTAVLMPGSGNIPKWTDGRFGGALEYDGVDDYALSTHATAWDISATEDITYEAWVKMSGYMGSSGGYITGHGSGPVFFFNEQSTYDYILGFYSGTVEYGDVLTYEFNKWYHVAVVRKVGESIKFYRDGVLAGISTDFTPANEDENNMPIGGTAWPFKGAIDEFKFYRYARTPAQIIEDMNAGHPAPGSPVGSAIAEWRFDEGGLNTCSGGVNDFCDATTNGNDLAFSTTTGGYSASGKYEKAFNGTNAVWASKTDDADFDVSATDDYSISLWYRSDNATNPSTTEYLVNKANATTAGYAVYANSSDQLCFGIDDDASWGPDISSCTTTDFYDTTWHNLVAVRDYSGTDKTYLYIDGFLRDSDSDTTTATLENSLSFYLADRDGTDNGDEFTGDLDQVKIFRSALTADQVKLLYNKGSNAALGTLSTNSSTLATSDSFNDKYCVPGDTTSCNPPVAEWHFDENTATAAKDSADGDDVGTLTNGPLWIPGKTGTALQFENSTTSDDYVSITDTGDLDLTSAFTIESWVNSNDGMGTGTGDFFTIFSNSKIANSVPRNGIALYLFAIAGTAGYPHLSVNDTSGGNLAVGSNFPITLNKWQFVGATFTDSTNATKVIVNGLVGQADTTTLTDTADFTSTDVKIGRLHNNTPDSTNDYGSFHGKIDIVRVFDYVRTPAQIAWDYSRGAPIVWYKFDECSGTTANNSGTNTGYNVFGSEISPNLTITIGASGSENTVGTCSTSSTSWGNGVTGKRNYSLDLDGTDDYAYTSTNHYLNAYNSLSYSNVSWGGWFNPGATPVSDFLFSRTSTSNVGEYRLITDADGKPRCEIYTGGAWDTTNAAIGSNALSNNTWNHVMCVYNGATLKVFVNGTESGSVAQTGSITSTTNGREYIGRDYTGTSTTYFDGQVDEIKIFNYDLTLPLLYREMNDGTVRFGPETGSP